MDARGLKSLLTRIAAGELRLLARELPEPSPLCHEILNSHPYSFLDDAPLEERRARAVSTRRSLPPQDAAGIGALDAEAIATVRGQAAPSPRDADELHDLLLGLGIYREVLVPESWRGWLAELRDAGRVEERNGFFHATERRVRAEAALAGDAEAQLSVVRGWIDLPGPITARALAERIGLGEGDVSQALHRLESEGAVLRGRFSPGAADTEWCERGLLARIHRLTLGRLRREIEPVTAAQYLSFLCRWQHLAPGTQLHGAAGLLDVLGQLQGFALAAAAWEREVLPARVSKYDPILLDQLCFGGQLVWGRFAPPPQGRAEIENRPRRNGPSRAAPIAFALRMDLPWILSLARREAQPCSLGESASALRELLARRGALFRGEIQGLTGYLASDLEQGLWELVAAGEISCDGFGGLRALLDGEGGRSAANRWPRNGPRAMDLGGRWSLLNGEPRSASDSAAGERTIESLARQLLRRYGVVFRDVLVREVQLPPWRELLWAYRRLEARGEIRGGRFVGSGLGGEQFALPEAVEALRALRREGRTAGIG